MHTKDTHNRICLGAIVGAHGIRGEVKVKSFTEPEDKLGAYGALSDQEGTRSFVVKTVGRCKELLRCKIKGIEDRTAAEKLVGTGLYIEREALPETSSDEYYQADLIGLEVRRVSDNEPLGRVVGLYNFGAGDILEIKLLSDGHTEMLPFTKAYVPDVCPDDGYLTVCDTSMNFAPEDNDDDAR